MNVFDKLSKYLETELVTEEIDYKNDPNSLSLYNAFLDNCLSSESNNGQFEEEDLIISCYWLKKTEDSEIYFINDRIQAPPKPYLEFVIVFLEKLTGTYQSNSKILFEKLIIEIGYTEEDITNNTPWYNFYSNVLENYQSRFNNQK